jgi:hypothetical protein
MRAVGDDKFSAFLPKMRPFDYVKYFSFNESLTKNDDEYD